MSLTETTVSTNTGHVEQATSAMSAAMIDDVERRANASVTTIKEEAARAEAEEHKISGKDEARLYGDIIAEATGFKAITTAAELIGDRKADLAGSHVEGVSGNARHIESDIALTNRSPGLYRNPHEQTKFGAVDTVADTVAKPAAPVASGRSNAGVHKEDIMASANIASSSLKEQEKDAVGTWGVKETKMTSVQLAKQLTYGQEISNELALQSARVARQEHTAAMGKAYSMAPGMDLSSGPRFNVNQLSKLAEEESSMNSWRTQQS